MGILERDERGGGAALHFAEPKEVRSRKGRSRSDSLFTSAPIDKPAPPDRVALLSWRYSKGLDLWTGEHLKNWTKTGDNDDDK
jgi:hypothetical protein